MSVLNPLMPKRAVWRGPYYYTFYLDSNYDGSNRFAATTLKTGTAELTLQPNSLCVTLNDSITILSSSVTLEIDLSADIRAMSDHDVFFTAQGYFQFPAHGNTYCFVIDSDDASVIDSYSRADIYGVILLEGYILYISSLTTLIPYEEFWEGWVVGAVGLSVVAVWAVVKFKIEKKNGKTKSDQ